MRNGAWIVGGGLAVLVVAGVAAFLLSNRTETPQPPAASTAAETPASAPAATAASSETEAPAATQTQLVQTEAGAADLYPDDKILGDPAAPLIIIEYASLTCPHCARFHETTFPKIKSEYVDKGLARFVYRDFPLDGEALNASLLAHCVPDERYFNMLEVLFRSQAEWAGSADPKQALSQIGRTAGLSQEKIDACATDTAETDKIILRVQEAQSRYGVQSTPTLVINGETHAGALPYEEFDKILKSKLP